MISSEPVYGASTIAGQGANRLATSCSGIHFAKRGRVAFNGVEADRLSCADVGSLRIAPVDHKKAGVTNEKLRHVFGTILPESTEVSRT